MGLANGGQVKFKVSSPAPNRKGHSPIRPNGGHSSSTAAPAASSREATSNPSSRVLEFRNCCEFRKCCESGKYSGRMAAQTTSTQETASSAISARRACTDISAAAANNPIASTKSACANAATNFEVACNSLTPVAASIVQRNTP